LGLVDVLHPIDDLTVLRFRNSDVCHRGRRRGSFNTAAQMLSAALAGYGLTFVPEGMARPHVAKGRLKRVLADWSPPFSGYHLWYPSRRQSSAAFALLVDALRYRG
jgi:DNA-binding transcriptional LysR family regulator